MKKTRSEKMIGNSNARKGQTNASRHIGIRCTEEQYAAWQSTKVACGCRSMSGWIVSVLDKASKQ